MEVKRRPIKIAEINDWLDTTYKSKTPEYLSEEEIYPSG